MIKENVVMSTQLRFSYFCDLESANMYLNDKHIIKTLL